MNEWQPNCASGGRGPPKAIGEANAQTIRLLNVTVIAPPVTNVPCTLSKMITRGGRCGPNVEVGWHQSSPKLAQTRPRKRPCLFLKRAARPSRFESCTPMRNYVSRKKASYEHSPASRVRGRKVIGGELVGVAGNVRGCAPFVVARPGQYGEKCGWTSFRGKAPFRGRGLRVTRLKRGASTRPSFTT